jgi:uncharacterized repeat protein (TIGR03803 family)
MRRVILIFLFNLLVATAIASPAQVVTTIATFDPGTTGNIPNAPLVQASDGNFYGTTVNSGAFYGGTVFKVTPAGTLTVLHSFCEQQGCADGDSPSAALVQASDGNFYGTTYSGGDDLACQSGCGTVFRITLGGRLTTLHLFDGHDGKWPAAQLTQASDGNLYGTTVNGGAYGMGTVFKMALDGTLITLYSFHGQDGNPYARLVQGSDGNFYGTTAWGGTDGVGTVFRVTPQGSLTTLHSFTGPDGAYVPAGLVQASDGNFYGTTVNGGPDGNGTIFRITPDGTLTTLHTFPDYTLGRYPSGLLVQGTDGNLYGATRAGGFYQNGTVFKMTLEGDLTSLHSFNSSKGEGSGPGTLMQATDGNFYGVTGNTVFRLLGTSYHLIVTGNGNGTITSGDGLINCGWICFDQYKPADVVTLTATPNTNWAFSSWTGCDHSQDNVCTGTMNKDRQITATFTPEYLLSVFNTGNGTVTSADGHINCGNTCSYWYLSGSPVTLTAAPDPGWALDQWFNCDSFQGTTCSLTMNGQRSAISVWFSPGFVLSVQKSGNGLITSSDGDINCGATCFYSYVTGRSVTLTAYPDQNFTFGGWSGCDQVYGKVCIVAMNSARNTTATFIPPHQLTVSEAGNGAVISGDGYINCGSSCSHTYVDGSVVNLTATPGQGWGLASWSGCDRTNLNVCTVAMNNNRTVSATFKVLYALSIGKTGNGTVSSVDGHIYCGSVCSYSYIDGMLVTLSAVPAPGYTLTGWTGCDNVNGSYCLVTMTGAKNVTASFTPASIMLTSLTFKPSYVKGGQLSAGTLTLSGPAPDGGVTVALSSDRPGVAHPPSFVFVPGGKSSVGFAVQTFPVKSNTTVTITATAGSSHVSGTVTVGITSLPPSLR